MIRRAWCAALHFHHWKFNAFTDHWLLYCRKCNKDIIYGPWPK